ncbi:TraJ protein [Rahnella sp. BCC 1045]|uniref:TraJ protein n=1 Tax=Rahnella sp. BCC 1045 TaxID=2816251 RepID=UPI001C253353|nr:TraJ protein [Rahnella sp. BCC 1045]MBU9819688.1 TraJ protein [Rahnella sp. BCC 1045]
MAAVDPSQFSPLHKFFPELTELQAVHTCMLVFGHLSVAELAELRDIAPNTVMESMSSAQKKLGVGSMKHLRITVTNRVLMHIALYIFK